MFILCCVDSVLSAGLVCAGYLAFVSGDSFVTMHGVGIISSTLQVTAGVDCVGPHVDFIISNIIIMHFVRCAASVYCRPFS